MGLHIDVSIGARGHLASLKSFCPLGLNDELVLVNNCTYQSVEVLLVLCLDNLVLDLPFSRTNLYSNI